MQIAAFWGGDLKWREADLNRRHPHFQCGALPTELPRLRRTRGGQIVERTQERGPLQGRQRGLEPPTSGITIRRSNQLSYCRQRQASDSTEAAGLRQLC